MRQSSQTKTGLVEVFPKGREGISSLPREHCLTLCLIFGCETMCQDSQEGVSIQGECGVEWTKKVASPGFHFFLKCIYLFWERANNLGRGRERKKPKQVLRCQCRARQGIKLMNHEIMTWAKIESRMFNWLSHPDAPGLHFLLDDVHVVKWILKYRHYGLAANLWPLIFLSKSL